LEAPPEHAWREEVRFFRPSAEARHWIELVMLRLERARLAAPVARVVVAATSIGKLELRQQELFAPSEPAAEAKRELATLVNRLVGRLGHRQVVRAALAPDPLPEHSFRTTPVVSEGRSSKRAAPIPWRPLERPLELLPAARHTLQVTVDEAGAPRAFHWRGEEYRIAESQGPERIESGWWRGTQRRRDYYRVETDRGHRAWLYRRRNDGRWFLHGWFA